MKLFITGSDTGVGKTVVTAGLAGVALANGSRVSVYKPIQSGCINDDDGDIGEIRQHLGENPHLIARTGYCFAPPATPWVADPEGTIELAKIVLEAKQLARQSDVLLVEGAGGVRVPIDPNTDMIDLMGLLNLPVLVVVRPDLGTINHTLLSIDALLHREIPVAGVVISNMPANSNDPAIASVEDIFSLRLGKYFLGSLPALSSEDIGSGAHLALGELFMRLTQGCD